MALVRRRPECLTTAHRRRASVLAGSAVVDGDRATASFRTVIDLAPRRALDVASVGARRACRRVDPSPRPSDPRPRRTRRRMARRQPDEPAPIARLMVAGTARRRMRRGHRGAEHRSRPASAFAVERRPPDADRGDRRRSASVTRWTGSSERARGAAEPRRGRGTTRSGSALVQAQRARSARQRRPEARILAATRGLDPCGRACGERITGGAARSRQVARCVDRPAGRPRSADRAAPCRRAPTPRGRRPCSPPGTGRSDRRRSSRSR